MSNCPYLLSRDAVHGVAPGALAVVFTPCTEVEDDTSPAAPTALPLYFIPNNRTEFAPCWRVCTEDPGSEDPESYNPGHYFFDLRLPLVAVWIAGLCRRVPWRFRPACAGRADLDSDHAIGAGLGAVTGRKMQPEEAQALAALFLHLAPMIERIHR